MNVGHVIGLACAALVLAACHDKSASDTNAPDTRIDGGPHALSASRNASFSFASTEANSMFEASVDGAAFVRVAASITLTGISDGPHSISVRAIDPAGNVDPTPAQVDWTVDATPPAVKVLFPTPVSYTTASTLSVRGTTSDAGAVTSASINQIPVVSTDGFRTWSATLQIAPGENQFVVSATDAMGNTNPTAATFSVANRGIPTVRLRGLAFDDVHDQVLVADADRNAVIVIRRSDGFARILSDAEHGSGPSISAIGSLAVDTVRNRAIFVSSGRIFAVDLLTGDRSLLSSPTASDPAVGDAVAFDGASNRAFVTGGNLVLAVDLTTGSRTILSGGAVGNGPAFTSSETLALDTSSGSTRLLLLDTFDHSIISINTSNGDRTLVSKEGTAGTGTALVMPSSMQVDGANHRVLLTDMIGSNPSSCRLVAIDLASGDRTEVSPNPAFPMAFATGMVLDPTSSRVFISLRDRSRFVQLDLRTLELSRFSDSDVGTGPNIGSYTGGLSIDLRGNIPVLYVAPGPIIRIDLASANRAAVVPTSPTSPFVVNDFFVDLPQTAGTSLRGLMVAEGDNAAVSFLFDLTTGASLPGSNVSYATLSGTSHWGHMAPDEARSRMIVPIRVGSIWHVSAMERPSGITRSVSWPGRVGTGPDFGEISAVTVAAASKIVVTDRTPSIFAVDPDSGDRTVVASNTGTGSGLPLFRADDMDADDANNRVLVISSIARAIEAIDLGSGNRTLVSGIDPDDQSMRGDGPPLSGGYMKIKGDFSAGVAYVYTGTDTLLAVDIVSGDRVIAAR